MSYLVDTDVFSEPVKPRPDAKVVAWLREHESELYVSPITIGDQLTLVTHNTAHFERTGVAVLNPFA